MGSVSFPTPANTVQWADDFLLSISAPQTPANVAFVSSWENAESGTGYGYNPLGSEQREPGSTNANSAGVQGYTSWAEGIAATDSIIGQKNNQTLLATLQSGLGTNATLRYAVESAPSSWDTGDSAGVATSGATKFLYGGANGMTRGAPAVSGQDNSPWAHIKSALGLTQANANNVPASTSAADQAVNSAAAKANPLNYISDIEQWAEKGAADVTFVVFGLLLVLIGLVVTFKSQAEEGASVAAVAA